MTQTPPNPDFPENAGVPQNEGAPQNASGAETPDGHQDAEAAQGAGAAERPAAPQRATPNAGPAHDAGVPLDARAEPDAGAGGDSDAPLNAHASNLKEPRSDQRLQLEFREWRRVSPKYIVVQIIGTIIFFVIALVVFGWLGFTGQTWAWIVFGVAVIGAIIELVITPRQAKAIGYQLRDDDLVFRRGIMWQRIVAVPYGRMQLVDITRGPLARGLGLAEVKLVTAAAATGVSIPGIPNDEAEKLRDHLVEVAETRRAGL
ncbi:PH domain-containing protein [Microbacterium sp. MPKO10]|uniref:PH domain-containing protein n=1 Tax=Microbacterium sp. MPKO10 TaxID=2989818 RepID=UPI002235C4E1|nr:PH domain-containing protein [Microbacterium sp. MPKO10]MCW4458829.1 PH domain-containing protein [Microbacterium sp. MPKO10]